MRGLALFPSPYSPVVSLFLYSLIARWIFKVDTNTHYNKAQADLLVAIAKKLEVPMEDIYKAIGQKIPKPKN